MLLLFGNCTEVCAVKINLHELLLENRHESVEEGGSNFAERTAWKMWKQAMLHRKFMNMGSSKVKNWVINRFLKDWKKHRGDIEFRKNLLMRCGERNMVTDNIFTS
jgi:L-lactate dehydrogenase complex protein LldF